MGQQSRYLNTAEDVETGARGAPAALMQQEWLLHGAPAAGPMQVSVKQVVFLVGFIFISHIFASVFESKFPHWSHDFMCVITKYVTMYVWSSTVFVCLTSHVPGRRRCRF